MTTTDILIADLLPTCAKAAADAREIQAAARKGVTALVAPTG